MESNSKTTLKVGAFLAIGIFVILVTIFFLGAERALFKSYARLRAHFTEVQGLANGSVVSLSGVVVGNVEDITFVQEKNMLEVIMKVDKDYLDKIREGSQVEIRTQGALGDKFIFIIPGSAKNPPVKNGDLLEIAPATDLFGIISERGKETGKIFDLIDEMHRFALSLNAGNKMANAISNLELSTSRINNVIAKIGDEGGAEKMRNTVDRLDSILTKIDKGEGTLGALINDPSVHNQLKSLLGGSARKNNMKSLIRTSIEKSEE